MSLMELGFSFIVTRGACALRAPEVEPRVEALVARDNIAAAPSIRIAFFSQAHIASSRQNVAIAEKVGTSILDYRTSSSQQVDAIIKANPTAQLKERKKTIARGRVKNIGTTWVYNSIGAGVRRCKVRNVHRDNPAPPCLRDGGRCSPGNVSCALYACVWRSLAGGRHDGALGMHPSVLGGG